jgi:hypothetical protein
MWSRCALEDWSCSRRGTLPLEHVKVDRGWWILLEIKILYEIYELEYAAFE